MIEIPLTRGAFALIDDQDRDLISGYTWQAHGDRLYTLYATARKRIGNKRITVRMHRLIMGLSPKDISEVDHINGNGLDNRRANLRIVTHRENQCNSRPRRNKHIKYKGVDLCRDGKWRARCTVNGHTYHLGRFRTAKEAASAYNDFARRQFGLNARLNRIS